MDRCRRGQAMPVYNRPPERMEPVRRPRRPRPRRPAPAFTVLELVVVMSIGAVVAAIAIPRAGRFLDRLRVRAAMTDVRECFAAARHLAIMRDTRAAVLLDSAADAVRVVIGGDTVLRRALGTEHGVELLATRDSMAFTPIGLGYGAANLRVIARRRSAAETLYVSRMGRVR